MINFLKSFPLLTSFPYLTLFIIVVFEGPIASVVAGIIIAHGTMNFYAVYLLVMIADLVGDSIYYSLGRWGGRFGLKLFGIKEEKIQKLALRFNNNGGKSILFGKITHGIGGLFILAAGTAHMPFRKFLLFSTIGTIPKTLILILVGYFFGQSYLRINKYFDFYALISLALGLILLSGYILFAKKIKKKHDL